MSRHERYIVIHETFGIYLGMTNRGVQWSKLDNGAKDTTAVFLSHKEASRFVGNLSMIIEGNYSIKRIHTMDETCASMSECVEAGEEAWIPYVCLYNITNTIH